MNQPATQFMKCDDHFPYRIYGAQQDNSTIRINHRSSSSHISERDWEQCWWRGAHLAPDPLNNEIVFG